MQRHSRPTVIFTLLCKTLSCFRMGRHNPPITDFIARQEPLCHKVPADCTEIVVKIDRLGKNIAERFAHRYYHEVTVGIDFTARDLQNRQRAQGLPWEIRKAVDHSADGGTFVPVEQIGNVNQIPFHLNINGSTVQAGNTQDMLFPIDRIIAYVRLFFSL